MTAGLFLHLTLTSVLNISMEFRAKAKAQRGYHWAFIIAGDHLLSPFDYHRPGGLSFTVPMGSGIWPSV